MNLVDTLRMQLPQASKPFRVRRSGDGRHRAMEARAAVSTIAIPYRPIRREVGRSVRRAASWSAALLRGSWRFLLIAALLSFATAWMGTRALMAGVEESLTRASLASVRHENQALRDRQELLRERMDLTYARLAASETSLARTR